MERCENVCFRIGSPHVGGRRYDPRLVIRVVSRSAGRRLATSRRVSRTLRLGCCRHCPKRSLCLPCERFQQASGHIYKLSAVEPSVCRRTAHTRRNPTSRNNWAGHSLSGKCGAHRRFCRLSWIRSSQHLLF